MDYQNVQLIKKGISNMASNRLLKVDDLGYNPTCAEVAQVVEQRTENPRVTSSTLVLGTSQSPVIRL